MNPLGRPALLFPESPVTWVMPFSYHLCVCVSVCVCVCVCVKSEVSTVELHFEWVRVFTIIGVVSKMSGRWLLSLGSFLFRLAAGPCALWAAAFWPVGSLSCVATFCQACTWGVLLCTTFTEFSQGLCYRLSWPISEASVTVIWRWLCDWSHP